MQHLSPIRAGQALSLPPCLKLHHVASGPPPDWEQWRAQELKGQRREGSRRSWGGPWLSGWSGPPLASGTQHRHHPSLARTCPFKFKGLGGSQAQFLVGLGVQPSDFPQNYISSSRSFVLWSQIHFFIPNFFSPHEDLTGTLIPKYSPWRDSMLKNRGDFIHWEGHLMTRIKGDGNHI